MTTGSASRKPKSLYQVIYRNGSTFTTAATCPVIAELQAVRKRPGPVLKIKFLRKI